MKLWSWFFFVWFWLSCFCSMCTCVFTYECPIAPAPFVQKLCFLYLIAFTLLSKISWASLGGPISGFFSVNLCVIPSTCILGYCNYTMSWNQVVWFLLLYSSSFQSCFSYFKMYSLFAFSYKFKNSLYMKKYWWNFEKIALNLYINLGKLDIFATLGLPVHKHGTSYHLDILWIPLSAFCSFQHINLHVLS